MGKYARLFNDRKDALEKEIASYVKTYIGSGVNLNYDNFRTDGAQLVFKLDEPDRRTLSNTDQTEIREIAINPDNTVVLNVSAPGEGFKTIAFKQVSMNCKLDLLTALEDTFIERIR